MDKLAKLESLGLTESERKAYEKYVSECRPPLSTKTAADMFELYLSGSSCEEIAKLNPGMGLGIIVRARVDNDWDSKKEEYLSTLYQKTREIYQKTQLEAVEFAAISMSVYRKLWGDKFKKFLQDGKAENLEDFQFMSLKQYKDFAEMLLKLTGQENTQKQHLTGEVVHRVAPTTTNSKLTPKDAADILKIIDADFTKK
jgi:hypothetical protein